MAPDRPHSIAEDTVDHVASQQRPPSLPVNIAHGIRRRTVHDGDWRNSRELRAQHHEQELGSPILRAGQSQFGPRSPSRGSARSTAGSPKHGSPKIRSRSSLFIDRELDRRASDPFGGIPLRERERFHSDHDDVASTAASTAASSPASPTSQAAILLLKNTQRRRRELVERGDEVRENQDRKAMTLHSFGSSSASSFRMPENSTLGAGGHPEPGRRSRPTSSSGQTRPGSDGSISPNSPNLMNSSASASCILALEERSDRRLSTTSSTGVQESGLLLRRRNQRPQLGALTIDRNRVREAEREREAERVEREQTMRRIRPLPAGEKIYDLYYWNEVIQETGCGGKVVVCAPKAIIGERSPLLPSSRGSPFGKSSSSASLRMDAESPRSPHGTHVMKIKSKAELRKAGAEEQFRKAHLKMLNLPPHMGVLPLTEVLEDDGFYYVVMEKATGGSLLSSLVQEYSDGNMPERAMKKLMREILSAIGHIHEQGMLHRDIKADNLVVHVHDEPSSPTGRVREVKLIDFDIADPDWEPHSPGKNMPSWAGTLRNSAPETFAGTFSQQSDLYSVGTVLYLLMAGRLPYDDVIFDPYDSLNEDLEPLSGNLSQAKIDWSEQCWTAQPDCRDFCMWLLNFNPDLRPASAEEAASHPWLRE